MLGLVPLVETPIPDIVVPLVLAPLYIDYCSVSHLKQSTQFDLNCVSRVTISSAGIIIFHYNVAL